MNIIPKIVSLILKTNHQSVFKNTLTKNEVKLGLKIDFYNRHTGRNLEILNDISGTSILVWYSTTQYFIACPIDETGFKFSKIGVYTEGIVIDINTYFNSDVYKIGVVSREAKENQSLLKMLSRNVEKYFK